MRMTPPAWPYPANIGELKRIGSARLPWLATGGVPHGYDAGKKIEGKKRHILVDNSRPPAPRHRSSRRHSRSRWRRSGYGDTVRHVSIFEDAVRRQRTKICEGACKSIEIVKRSDQVADLWSCPNADRRTHHCMAQTLPRLAKDWEEKRSRSCASPQSASCSENSAIPPEVSGRTLSKRAI